MAKPIFTGSFVAFSDADREILTSLVKRVARPACRIAEIGSWLGNGSTLAILDAISGIPDARLLCVDHWQGSPGVKRHSAIASEFDVFGTFRHNTAAYANQIDVASMDSLSAAADPSHGPFDLIFIDGDHTYDAGKNDIGAWLPKLKTGGLLCGHDCEIRVTPETEEMLRAHQNFDFYEIPNFKFAGIHPGVVLAVHDYFSGRAYLFAENGSSSIWIAPG
jgi:predicted O-methyltransferase YrrM